MFQSFRVFLLLPLLALAACGGMPGMGGSQRAAVNCQHPHGTVSLGFGATMGPAASVSDRFESSGCFTVVHENMTAMQQNGRATSTDYAASVSMAASGPPSIFNGNGAKNAAMGAGGLGAVAVVSNFIPVIGPVIGLGIGAVTSQSASNRMSQMDIKLDVREMKTGRSVTASGSPDEAADEVTRQLFPGDAPKLMATAR